jgi:hypothetical protein
MKKISMKSVCLIALAALAFAGCEKQLEIDPRQSIDASTALTSREAIDASITSIYSRLKSARWYGRDFITHPDAFADNGHATNASGRLLPESNNVFGATFTATPWTSGYAGINQINLTIDAVQAGIPNASTTQVNNWLGQLYFLRGLYYFDLMRIYAYDPGAVVDAQNRGGVPLVLTGIKNATSALAFKPSRAPIDEVYAAIVADLKRAEPLLSASSAVGVTANRTVVQALLARVSLYNKNYSEAKSFADAVITQRGSTTLTTANYVSSWRASLPAETIFGIRFAANNENIGVNESLQTSFTTIVTLPGSSSATGGFGDLVPTLDLLNQLGISLTGGNTNNNFLQARGTVASYGADVRGRLYEGGTAGRTKGWVECTKFLGKNGFINLDDIPVLRMSEMYLIRAEAAATPGSPVFSEANAKADLKFLKSRRYEGYAGSAIEAADDALTGSALFEEILRQRRLEFAFEGHRFFDLKRLGRAIVKGAPNPNPAVEFSDRRILAPIFQADVDGNPNLQQNFGY